MTGPRRMLEGLRRGSTWRAWLINKRRHALSANALPKFRPLINSFPRVERCLKSKFPKIRSRSSVCASSLMLSFSSTVTKLMGQTCAYAVSSRQIFLKNVFPLSKISHVAKANAHRSHFTRFSRGNGYVS